MMRIFNVCALRKHCPRTGLAHAVAGDKRVALQEAV